MTRSSADEVAFSREAPLFASLSAHARRAHLRHSRARRDPPFRARRPHRRSCRLADRARRGRPCSRRPARCRQRALPFADGDPSDGRRRRRLGRPGRASHRARAHYARRLAHLAAQRASPAVRPSRLDGIPEEPDQTHGGRRGRDDDAGGPEGRPAHGDGRRSGRCCRSACSISASKRSRPCSSRRWRSPPPTSPGRGSSGGATTA